MTTREQYGREELDRAIGGLSPSALEAASRLFRVAGSDPLRGALVTRLLNAFSHSTEELDERSMSEAASASSDYDVLLRVLQAPEVLDTLSEADPLADARLRGLEARARLLEAEGGTLSADEAARRLGLGSREAVNKRRKAGRLLALSTGRRGYRYPAWQFGDEGVLPGFEEALRSLGVVGGWGRAAFFLGGNAGLGGERPLDLLRSGSEEEVEAVIEAARYRGEQIAE